VPAPAPEAAAAPQPPVSSIPQPPPLRGDEGSGPPPITGPAPAPVTSPPMSTDINVGHGASVGPGLTPNDANPSHYPPNGVTLHGKVATP
jgi:hypothetical protein